MSNPNTKVIINCALTGMIPTKELNQLVPLTPEEIAKDADIAVNHGASIVHVHASQTEALLKTQNEFNTEGERGRMQNIEKHCLMQ